MLSFLFLSQEGLLRDLVPTQLPSYLVLTLKRSLFIATVLQARESLQETLSRQERAGDTQLSEVLQESGIVFVVRTVDPLYPLASLCCQVHLPRTRYQSYVVPLLGSHQ